ISTRGNRTRTLDATGVGSTFFEERADIVLTVGRDLPRSLAITPSRGVAAGDDERTIHTVGPSLGEPFDFDAHESHRREASLLAPIEAELAGRGDIPWKASIVAFRQDVWVKAADGSITTDRREGCRAELKLGTTVDHVYAPNETGFPRGKAACAIERFE